MHRWYGGGVGRRFLERPAGAHSIGKGVAVAALSLLVLAGLSTEARVDTTTLRMPVVTATPLSPECSARTPAHEGRRAFRRIQQAMAERRAARVLAIGSSSIVGVGASSPRATFTVQLEEDLERTFKGADFDVIGRGMSGEVAERTAERIKSDVGLFDPDLVVWQVGTNDGVSHVDQENFTKLLIATLRWLDTQRRDVVLIDPQFANKYAGDDHYKGIVRTIGDVARRERVPLVTRYRAMEELARQHINRSYMASDLFHLNDLGYKCMAEFAAQAIEVGVRQALIEGQQAHN